MNVREKSIIYSFLRIPKNYSQKILTVLLVLLPIKKKKEEEEEEEANGIASFITKTI